MPDTISPIQKGAALLAPLAGYSTSVFRRIVHQLGASLTVTEMISAEGTVRYQQGTMDYFRGVAEEPFTIVQLFGSNPHVVADAAAIAVDHGARMIDINMGCPVKKVVKNGSGAALMKDPRRAAKMIEVTRSRIAIPLTIKIRAGWDHQSLNYREMGKIAESEGAAAITLHPRTRSQGYGEPAQWDYIADLVQNVSIPVIGNGDIMSADMADLMLNQTGCHAVMIGRAALKNPWIFKQIVTFREQGIKELEPTPDDILNLIGQHLDRMIENVGERYAVITFRKFLTIYLSGIPGAAQARARLFKIEQRHNLLELVKDIISRNA